MRSTYSFAATPLIFLNHSQILIRGLAKQKNPKTKKAFFAIKKAFARRISA